ncbi:hypothetical protein AWB92_03655 [Mycobacterium sp. IEC1808]|nr:hypothetical protein AWB92_03655 [Mycobacterium sp. IEC1808]
MRVGTKNRQSPSAGLLHSSFASDEQGGAAEHECQCETGDVGAGGLWVLMSNAVILNVTSRVSTKIMPVTDRHKDEEDEPDQSNERQSQGR